MQLESRTRSIAKAISWRILATLTTIVLVFAVTGKATLALTVGGFEIVAKIVIQFLHERAWNRVKWGRSDVEPRVFWFTGLSGSGKSTLANATYDYLKSKGYRVQRLDGDQIRKIFPQTGFTRSERENHVRRIGHLASVLEQNGVFVVASFISPYRESRDFVRNLCKNFVEIHVSTPIETCEKRDIKGLYARAKKGEIKNFTGVNDPYEAPDNPEISIDSSSEAIDHTKSQLIQEIRTHMGRPSAQ